MSERVCKSCGEKFSGPPEHSICVECYWIEKEEDYRREMADDYDREEEYRSDYSMHSGDEILKKKGVL